VKKAEVTLIIPMAGAGRRFAEAGYVDPKPFIPVRGQPMVLGVFEDALRDFDVKQIIVLVRDDNLLEMVSLATRYLDGTGIPFKAVAVPELTQGAACTVLLAKDAVSDPRRAVLVANCDQRFRIDSKNFAQLTAVVSGIPLCFEADPDDPASTKWSYVRFGVHGNVTSVVEKPAEVPNPPVATCGVYWYETAQALFVYIQEMVARNDRSGPNAEFYLAPVYNRMLLWGEVVPYFVESFDSLGTPEDLEAYLKKPTSEPEPK